MIRLHTDYLVFKTPRGNYPCPIALVIEELLGESKNLVAPPVMEMLVRLLAHHFQVALNKTVVTVDEFLDALVDLLRQLGYQVMVESVGTAEKGMTSARRDSPEQDRQIRHRIINLEMLSRQTVSGGELLFYNRLKKELEALLKSPADIVELRGLRPCVKQIAGRKRWCPRCRSVETELLHFVQQQFARQVKNRQTILVVH